MQFQKKGSGGYIAFCKKDTSKYTFQILKNVRFYINLEYFMILFNKPFTSSKFGISLYINAPLQNSSGGYIAFCDETRHIIKNSLLSSCQHGFVRGRSCSTQLLKCLDIWIHLLDEGTSIDVIYLDFVKAFDSVSHKRLLIKLKAYME